MRSRSNWWLGVMCWVTLSTSAMAWDRKNADRPNILWLTSEDHGPHMGCYGDRVARTPHVDALAARGMRFSRCWSVAPVCAPARTVILTGLYNGSSGGLHMRSMVSLPAAIEKYPQYLRTAGYYCTNNSKEDYNVRVPKDLWNTSSGKAHWSSRPAGQPFFAVFNSTKSHESQIRKRPHTLVTDPALVRLPAYHPDTPEVRHDWAQYYDGVAAADAEAGARLKELDDAGLAEETIVFYFADHGSGMPRSKRWLGNSGLHVPLVVYFPEKWRHLAPKEYASGGVSDRLVSFVDLAPTLLSLTGTQPPEWMPGEPFAGPFQKRTRTLLFGERGRMDESVDLVRSATDGRYVYLRNFMPHLSTGQYLAYQFETPTTRVWRELFDAGKTTPEESQFWQAPKAPEELYDLSTDPDEVTNLANSTEHAAVLEHMRKSLRTHLLAIRDVCLIPEAMLHERSRDSTPYSLGHDDTRYPLSRILDAADVASRPSPSGKETDDGRGLSQMITDSDSAVRYWATLGCVIGGPEAIRTRREQIVRGLQDASPSVVIASAQALVLSGDSNDWARGLDMLASLANPQSTTGGLVAMEALICLESLGGRGRPVWEQVLKQPITGPLPDARYKDFIPRLHARLGQFGAGR